MRAYRANEIADIVGGTILAGDGGAEITDFSTNSKEGGPGTMFVPVIGERVDAHDFIADAYRHGMRASFTSRGEIVPDIPGMALIKVENNVAALQRFGAFVRNGFDLPVVGITGSVGKTTTKEMIAAALETGLVTLKTEGNMNSQVGLPRMMCRLAPEHEIAVIEMGMSLTGEMGRLAAVARPECAVMTNIGVSHIGQLGSKENIRREKLNIINEFPEGGTLFVNGDDPLLAPLAAGADVCAAVDMSERTRQRFAKAKVVTFGLGENCDFRASDIRIAGEKQIFTLHCKLGQGEHKQEVHTQEVTLSVLGEHNVRNALAALAVAWKYGIPTEKAAQGLASYSPIAMRGGKIEAKGVVLIDDTYNASPDSMRGGIDILMSTAAKRHIAVLADMLELGELSRECHEQVGEYAAARGVDVIVAIGSEARYYVEAAERTVKRMAAGHDVGIGHGVGTGCGRRVSHDGVISHDSGFGSGNEGQDKVNLDSSNQTDANKTNGGPTDFGIDKFFLFPDNNQALACLRQELRTGDAVLFKGSRGMKLDELVAAIAGR